MFVDDEAADGGHVQGVDVDPGQLEPIWQRLVAANPTAHEAEFARSLGNLGVRLARLTRHGDAVASTELAVLMWRRLVTENPVHEPVLAESLINLGTHLRGVHRQNEAIAAAEEGTRIFRRLAATDQAAYSQPLATALANLATLLIDRPYPEPLAVMEEEIIVRRHLASIDPAANAPHLARVLTFVAEIRTNLGDISGALRAIDEVVEISCDLARDRPAQFTGMHTDALAARAYLLNELDRDV